MDKKEVEKLIHERIKKDPSSLIPVKSLKELGLSRFECKVCGKNFWSSVKRDTCGDIECVGSYTFLDEIMTPLKLSYREMWNRFSSMFKDFGHKEISRYPVVARWRDDIYFVEAAIDDFAPYAIKGIVEPPANPLVVPQICLRFNDISNVGLTGRHLTSFIMAEEAAFNSKNKRTYFDKEAIKYIYKWLTDGMRLDPSKITFVEDAWVGAGYAGSSLEFFLGGLELGNQVYMRYLITENGLEEMDTKTIDMGAGLNRWVWVSMNTPTVYEAVFPKVIDFIKKKVGVYYNDDLLKRIYKFAGEINYEKTPLDEAIKSISTRTGIEEKELTKVLTDMQAIYSIADHTRTLLVSIHDGALPSNVGGGYNLRNILRRCLNFIDSKGWDIDLNDVINEHKKEFGAWFNELKDFDVSEIINKEKERYIEFKNRNTKVILELINESKISEEKISELYESKGITEEDIRHIALMEGKKITIPERAYTNINKRKENRELSHTYDIRGIKPTEKLFYKEGLAEAKAKIIKIIGRDHLILNKTIFYPEMGGQKPDGGTIDGINVIDVRINDNVIIHSLERPMNKRVGAQITMIVDTKRREALKKHHTATHIINQAARRVLGDFVYQNGAEKDVDKAHLDITYFDKLTDEQVDKIESLANEVVSKNLPITVKNMNRTEAEVKYGMRIYQGGAIPNAELRIVSIDDYDVEACGGLHCDRTSEVNFIKIIKAERIQDGVVRLTFMADKPALEYVKKIDGVIKSLMDLWGVKQDEVYKTAERFFSEAKTNRELYKKAEQENIALRLGITQSKEIDGVIEIETKLKDLGILSTLMKGSHKDAVILGDGIGIGKPKNDVVKNILSEKYKSVTEKGDIWFAHN